MKVNRLRRLTLGGGGRSWQWVKHAWLYPYLLPALTGEHLSAVGFQQRGPSVLRPERPSAGVIDRLSAGRLSTGRTVCSGAENMAP